LATIAKGASCPIASSKFVLSKEGREAIALFPHVQKRVVSTQSSAPDELNTAAVRDFVDEALPSLDPGKVLLTMRCLYQISPDRQMLLGKLREDDSIVVACGFSGGGFQHAPVIGAFLATMALGELHPLDAVV
jgi:glycine/D-amino acid oxidase-like deaminating enzyme